jgi:hypothetical protein
MTTPSRPLITLGSARPRAPTRTPGGEARLEALAAFLKRAPKTADFERVARWAALALRSKVALVYLVSRVGVRIIAAHGVEAVSAKRQLPREHGLLVPAFSQTLVATNDLELFSATLGLGFQPRIAQLTPLVADTQTVGALCVMDFETHDLDLSARQLLEEFAATLTTAQPEGDANDAATITDLTPSSPPLEDASEILRGQLEDIGGAAALAQMLAYAHPQGALRLPGRARLYLREARVVHVEHGSLTGASAVRELFKLETGAFGFDPQREPPQATLQINPTALTLELAHDPDRAILERERLIALPGLANALRFVSALGGAALFSARTASGVRWSGSRLVLHGRGMTALVCGATLEDWQNANA